MPLLVAAWWSAGLVTVATRRRSRFVVPATLAITGALLVGRGISDQRHAGEPAPLGHASHVSMR